MSQLRYLADLIYRRGIERDRDEAHSRNEHPSQLGWLRRPKELRDMADDFNPESVSWVLTDDDLAHLLEAIHQCEEVVMDLETTGLDEHATADGPWGCRAQIALGSLTLPTRGGTTPTTWVVPLAHPNSPWLGRWAKVMSRIASAILEDEKPLLNANVKFDVRWIYAHTGVDLSHRIVWDTTISSHLLDENSSTKLKDRAPVTFDVPPWDEFDLSTPGAALAVPMFDLGLYAARDTYWTWRLAVMHRETMYLGPTADEGPETSDEVEVARLGRLSIWCAMPTTAVLTSMEERGILMDREWVDFELDAHSSEAARLMRDLAVMYPGLDPADASMAPTSGWFRAWTDAAVKAGDLTVAELTPTGKSRWSKGVLIRQARHGSAVAQTLLDQRGHSKKAEFLRGWLVQATLEDTVHTTYNAGTVITGRLSSSGPNMQQVTATLRPAFVPRPGYVFADLDYGQIELRTAAFISRCEPMIEAFRRGDDLHAMLARQITGRETVTPEERQHGKAGNFGFLFGLGPFGFREYAETQYDVAFTLEEATQIHRAFFDTWEGLAAWHARTTSRVHQTGQVVSPIGRVRRLPTVWSANDRLASAAERAAINAPVQGFASDLMQIASASIEGVLPGYDPVPDARLVGTVHDSILVEVPENDWKAVTKSCIERMTNLGPVLARMDCAFDVPLVVDAKIGSRWGLSDVGSLT